MKLYRIDALQIDDAGDVCGMLTLFADNSVTAKRVEAAWLRDGWLTDAYIDDVELTEYEAQRLLGHTWPTLPIEELVALAKDPRRDAERQLEAILASRGRGLPALQRHAELEETWEPAEANDD